MLRSHLPDLTPLRENAAYRRLYAGFTLSNVGSQMAVVAIGLQVYDITGSTASVGLVGLFALVPLVVMGLYGGSLSDHHDRRTVALAANIVAWLTSIACAAQAWLGNDNVWVLYGIVAVWNGAFGVSSPARSSIYPRILPREQLPAANALGVFAMSTAMMVGPLLANGFGRVGLWIGFPLLLLALSVALALTAAAVRLPDASNEPKDRASANPPLTSGAFWIFAAIAVLYAFAEGAFGNWAAIYLSEAKALPAEVATLALSVFWAAMVMGRLLVAALVTRIAPHVIWLALPVLMMTAFLLLPGANTPALGLGLFALAGLGCSAFFPLTISLASAHFPEQAAWVSSMLIAALMVGVGLGSFVIGPLRQWLMLEQIYQFSTLYPVLVIGLAGWLTISQQ